MFQFLIGTLKTHDDICPANGVHVFQFLIGTLKTAASPHYLLLWFEVSIPHRYAKNPSDDEYTWIGYEPVLLTLTIFFFKAIGNIGISVVVATRGFKLYCWSTTKIFTTLIRIFLVVSCLSRFYRLPAAKSLRVLAS